jgi:V/A-type H+-transporting ATPase subunit A
MSHARIVRIGGPVLVARAAGGHPFAIGEALHVGAARLLGEVIKLKGDEITAQVYDATRGLAPGDPVEGTGAPLSVMLGPWLLGGIFDGLLRPLREDAEARRYEFTPLVAAGDRLEAGHAYGTVGLGEQQQQRCLLPPDLTGWIVSIAAAGSYDAETPLCEVRTPDGRTVPVTLTERWPVRRPRPVAERLPVRAPMITGQRILDTLFPIARGGQAAIPGGFGTGKTILQETIAKWCDADVIVYVGCGERGNEMAEVLHEFPTLADPRTGRALSERTVIVANTSNMPVAAREASIYTAVTVAEYFRDRGLDVALMADSTSRWAEALREVSGRLGELPGEAGYPAYLSSRLAEFYERAAEVKTLAGDTGSLTIIGAVSPAAGDFSEPVTAHTKRYVRCFWGLDRARAQARFYPAIHPLLSYSEHAERFSPWWTERGNLDWLDQRRQLLTLLEQQADLERMARIVGKDALPPEKQLKLICAELVNEAVLRQSAFSSSDRYCSPERQTRILRLVVRFIGLAEAALTRGATVEAIAGIPAYRRLERMSEDLGEDQLDGFARLSADLDRDLERIIPGRPDDATEEAADEA